MEEVVSTCVETCIRFKNLALICNRVGDGAGSGAAVAASKFSPGAGAA
jgi:hypothetical protein